MKKIIQLTKHFLLSEGQTSLRYQQRADNYCKWTVRIGIVACVIGIVCCFYFFSHAAAALFEAIKSSLANLK